MGELMTVEEADKLYEGYGKPLEKDHHGEYAAISRDGRAIVGKNDIEVVDRAIRELGSGNFVLYRVGYDYVYKIRRGECWSVTARRLSLSREKLRPAIERALKIVKEKKLPALVDVVCGPR